MAAKKMRIEPARIQRCGLVLETSVCGVCIASPLAGTLTHRAQAKPTQGKRLRACSAPTPSPFWQDAMPRSVESQYVLSCPEVRPPLSGFQLSTPLRAVVALRFAQLFSLANFDSSEIHRDR